MNKIIFIFFISLSCFSQNLQKKTYYYFNNNRVTQTQFESIDKRKIYTRKIENDSSIIKKIYFHKNTGKLDSVQYKQITMLFKKIIGSEFNLQKKTMIHLYRNNDKNIHKDSKYKKYWKWIKKNSNSYQSFLIGTKGSQIEPNKKKNIYIDEYNFIEKLFFQNSNFKINHLLLKPNGEVYIYFGLNNILQVLDWSVD